MEIQFPLLFFILFEGLGAGCALVAAVAEANDLFQSSQSRRHIVRWGAYLALPFLVIGLIFSPFHLGKPLEFWRGLSNLNSWIAWEGILGIAFLLVLAAFFAVQFLSAKGRSFSRSSRMTLAVLSLVVGLALVSITGMAYSTVRPIPFWNTPLTLLFFVVSALLMGTISVAAALGIMQAAASSSEVKGQLGQELNSLLPPGIYLAAGMLVIEALRLMNVGLVPNPAAQESAALLTGPYLGLVIVRFVLGLILPLGLLIYAWAKRNRGGPALPWIVTSLVAVLVGEGFTRALLFIAAIHI